MSMINRIYKRGDVFWARLGEGEGSEQSGLRPVVVIQNDIGNKFSPTVIVVIATTKTKNKLPTHFLLSSDKYDRLKYDTLIMTEQVRTLDKRRLGDHIASLDDIDTAILDKTLSISVQIDRINSDVMNEINTIKNRVIELDGFICGWARKGKSLIDLQDDFVERDSLLSELKTICRKYDMVYSNVYDETRLKNVLYNLSVVGVQKEMVG